MARGEIYFDEFWVLEMVNRHPDELSFPITLARWLIAVEQPFQALDLLQQARNIAIQLAETKFSENVRASLARIEDLLIIAQDFACYVG